MSAARPIDAAFSAGIAPVTYQTVSEWADAHRILSAVSSAEPGPWRTDRVPYMREVMDCLSARVDIGRVVLMKAAQLAGTECGLNALGYWIEHAPAPILYVMPTVDTGKVQSRTRVQEMIDATPALTACVKPARSRDSGNTLLLKSFPGGILRVAGANSAAGLRAMPIKYVIFDEVDAFPAVAGEEGSPIELATARTTTFPDRKLFFVSTPTVKGLSAIEREYQRGDQRRYQVPCPLCGAFQFLAWSRLKWEEGRPRSAWYECEHCRGHVDERHKGRMLELGRWVATAEPEEPGVRSYHINGLYAPPGWITWGELAAEFLRAKRDPALLQVFVNTRLAETWEDNAAKVSGEAVAERRETWTAVPAAVAAVTAGVDVQDDRLEVEFVGWGPDEESWSLGYEIISADPSGPLAWSRLDQLLAAGIPLDAKGTRALPVAAACIDTGGHHTLAVYAFCRAREARRVWAIKGRGGSGVQIWPRRPTRRNKGKVPLYIVGVDAVKESLYARLQLTAPGPGYCHFPLARGAEYFRQLTSERVVTKFHRGRPRRIWFVRDGVRNEALDCRVYATAALHGLYALGLRLERPAQPTERPAPERRAAQPQQRGWEPRPWLDGGKKWL